MEVNHTHLNTSILIQIPQRIMREEGKNNEKDKRDKKEKKVFKRDHMYVCMYVCCKNLYKIQKILAPIVTL